MDLKVSNKRQAGFTLLEIMIVVAIIGILSAIAIPTYLQWLPGYRLKSAVRDLQGHLQTAKMEAIKRGPNVPAQVVTIMFTIGPERIGNYVVFVDTNASGTPDGVEVRLATVTMPTNVSLTAVAPVVLTFNTRGLPNAAATITMQNNRGVWGQIDINLSGRANIQRSTVGVGGPYQQWD